MRKPTCVIYDRLSRLFAEEAPDHRIAECKRYAESQGWEVIHIATDTNVSGASKLEDRPGMREVLALLPRADFVLAAKLDRYARSVLEFYRLMDAAKSTRTTITTADNMVTPENSPLMIGMLAIFAAHEREAIKARITASKAHFRQRGNHLGGLAPYGYAVTGPINNKRWIIDEPAAAILRECADRLINHGGSLTALARELNERGVLPPAEHARQRDGRKLRGQRWHSTTLRDVLYTPAIRGWLVQATPGERRGALTNQPVLDAEGNPLSAGPAILDAETWSAVRASVDGKAKGRGAPRNGKSLLLHLAICSECDGPMYRQRRADNGKDYSTYVCRNGVGKQGTHRANVITAPYLEQLVTADFLKRFGSFALMRWQEADGSAVLQLGEISTQLDNLVGSLANLPAGGRAAQRATGQITALEARMTELEAEAAHAVGRWVDAGGTVADAWEQRDADGRRSLMADLGTRVAIRPATPGAERRFDPKRAAVTYAGPAWLRDADPLDIRRAEIELEEQLGDA
ncbi:recombinase family protein [Streptomyces sp. NPDC056192]|uniref:recombinase family protein n=1 Tax=Streptomyces sp. NPDC056192 TaxID=3345743 RepID=UPI0035DCA4DB